MMSVRCEIIFSSSSSGSINISNDSSVSSIMKLFIFQSAYRTQHLEQYYGNTIVHGVQRLNRTQMGYRAVVYCENL